MSKIIYVAFGFLVGVVFAKWRFESQMRANTALSSDNNVVNQQRVEEKQKHLDQIMVSFNSDEEITNDKVEHLLGVSDTSAERYLDELEKSGKLTQVGRTGRSVTYKKI